MKRTFIALLLVFAAPVIRAAGAGDLAPGQKLYTGKCARCHPLHDPTAYDDAIWKKWMEKMRRKAHLDDEQYQQLTEYLQSVRAHAGKR